jgi:hypothetical protein
MAAGAPQFQPTDTGKVSAWLRLAASQQSGGEWTPSIIDVLNAGSPMVQTDTDRRAAVGTSGNGLPTMVFDGTDIHLWPLSPGHSSTTKVGLWLWYKPATVSGAQYLYRAAAGQGGQSFNRIDFYAFGSTLVCEVSVTNTTGRSGATASGTLTAGAWHAIYMQYDSSRGGDANLAVYVGGVSKSLTFANIGTGATLTTLQAATAAANALIGGATDSDTPVAAIANLGELGPNLLALNDNLSTDEIGRFLTFEAPT